MALLDENNLSPISYRRSRHEEMKQGIRRRAPRLPQDSPCFAARTNRWNEASTTTAPLRTWSALSSNTERQRTTSKSVRFATDHFGELLCHYYETPQQHNGLFHKRDLWWSEEELSPKRSSRRVPTPPKNMLLVAPESVFMPDAVLLPSLSDSNNDRATQIRLQPRTGSWKREVQRSVSPRQQGDNAEVPLPPL